MDRLSGSRSYRFGGFATAIRFAAVVGGMAAACAGAGWAATLPAGADSQGPPTFGISLPSQHVAKSLKSQRLAPSEQSGMVLGTVSEVRLQAIDRDKVLQED